MLLFIVLFWNLQELMSKEMAKINRDVLMQREDQAVTVRASLSQSERKISMVGIKPHIPDSNVKPCSDSDEEERKRNYKSISESCMLKNS